MKLRLLKTLSIMLKLKLMVLRFHKKKMIRSFMNFLEKSKRKLTLLLTLNNKDMLKEQKLQIKNLDDKINRVVLKEDLDKTNKGLSTVKQNFNDFAEKVLNEYPSIKNMNERISIVEEHANRNFTARSQFQLYQDQINQKTENMNSLLNNLQANTNRINNEISEIHHNGAKKNHINQLKEEIAKCCMYDDLKNLYSKVIPSIHSFEENMIVLEKDIEVYKQIVKRFDELLMEKASKISVDKLYDELYNYLRLDDYNY